MTVFEGPRWRETSKKWMTAANEKMMDIPITEVFQILPLASDDDDDDDDDDGTDASAVEWQV